MKFLRDIRDEPEEPKPPNLRRFRFTVTGYVGFITACQAFGRSMFPPAGPHDADPIVVSTVLFLVILPVLLLIDLVRHLRLLHQLGRQSALEIQMWPLSPSDFPATNHPSRASNSSLLD